jgi:alcohol dehydrogenase
MSLSANWSYPTAIRFGAGRIAEIAEACAAAGIKKPLLVTDRGLASLPITQCARSIFWRPPGWAGRCFAEVDPNPNETNLEAGVEGLQGRRP